MLATVDVFVVGVTVVPDGWEMTVPRQCHAQLVVVLTAAVKVVYAFVNQVGLARIVPRK